MSANTSDLGRLKWAIALLVMLSAAGGGTVWTALQTQKSGDRDLKAATAARNEIRTKLARARDEQAELLDKIGRFEALKQRGFIGEEYRLDWVETLAKIKVARRLQRLDYDFAPQRPVEAAMLPGGSSAAGYTFVASQMRMKVQLLHEEELLALIESIRNAVPAMIQIRSCSLARITTAATDRSNPAQLTAECTLEWVTVKGKK